MLGGLVPIIGGRPIVVRVFAGIRPGTGKSQRVSFDNSFDNSAVTHQDPVTQERPVGRACKYAWHSLTLSETVRGGPRNRLVVGSIPNRAYQSNPR
jgi:hypothetical protein